MLSKVGILKVLNFPVITGEGSPLLDTISTNVIGLLSILLSVSSSFFHAVFGFPDCRGWTSFWTSCGILPLQFLNLLLHFGIQYLLLVYRGSQRWKCCIVSTLRAVKVLMVLVSRGSSCRTMLLLLVCFGTYCCQMSFLVNFGCNSASFFKIRYWLGIPNLKDVSCWM